MYHLKSAEEKLAALNEAKRVTKPGGYILVAYIMNEYSVITYAIKEKHIKEGIEGGMLDESFHCTEKANDLYSFVRLEDIEALPWYAFTLSLFCFSLPRLCLTNSSAVTS